MACRLDGAKPLYEPMMEYSNILIQDNAFENIVCEMEAKGLMSISHKCKLHPTSTTLNFHLEADEMNYVMLVHHVRNQSIILSRLYPEKILQ